MTASRPNEDYKHLQDFRFATLDPSIKVGVTDEKGQNDKPVSAAALFDDDAVIFVQPGASTKDEAQHWLPKNWGDIAGAKGCGPQVEGIRDHLAQFGNRKIFVLNTKLNHDTVIQEKNLRNITFVHATPELIKALGLPTFTAFDPKAEEERTYLARIVFIVNKGVITDIVRADTPANSATDTLCAIEKKRQTNSLYNASSATLYTAAVTEQPAAATTAATLDLPTQGM